MLKVFSHCSRVLVNRLPPPPIPALLNRDGSVGRLLFGEFVAKALELVFNGDVGDVRGDAQALRQLLDLAKPLGLGHRRGGYVAHRDIAACGDQLARQLAAHAGASTGNNSRLSCKILHGKTLAFPIAPLNSFDPTENPNSGTHAGSGDDRIASSINLKQPGEQAQSV